MELYVLRNQGAIVNKKAVSQVISKKDSFDRTIGVLIFNNSNFLEISNPSDYDLVVDDCFLEIDDSPVVNFNYIEFGLDTNHIDKHAVKEPISINPVMSCDATKNKEILFWIAHMFIKIKKRLGEE